MQALKVLSLFLPAFVATSAAYAARLAGVEVAADGTIHLMPDVEALWQAGIGGMAVTSVAIAAQGAATQNRARRVIARL